VVSTSVLISVQPAGGLMPVLSSHPMASTRTSPAATPDGEATTRLDPLGRTPLLWPVCAMVASPPGQATLAPRPVGRASVLVERRLSPTEFVSSKTLQAGAAGPSSSAATAIVAIVMPVPADRTRGRRRSRARARRPAGLPVDRLDHMSS
jgi:hypothetical protein